MTRKLILTLDTDPPRVIELDAATISSFHIGREPACDLVLPTEWISRKHCRIFRENARILIEDLQSRDGTFVNNCRLTRQVVLNDQDVIRVGDTDIRVSLLPRRQAFAETIAAPLDSKEKPAGMHQPSAPGFLPEKSPGSQEQDAVWGQTVRVTTRVIEDPGLESAIPLTADALFIGRDPQCGCPIPNPMVSWQHACITQENEKWVLEDLQSGNGTFVNGMRLSKPHRVSDGDVIGIGPIRFTLEEAMLVPRSSLGGLRITAHGISKEVRNNQDGKPLLLLNNIEFSIDPREFLVLLGRSGCGKSTFMDALNGRRPATSGTVYFDGMDLYEHFDAIKSAIGYVPQEVIFHDSLRLVDALRYSARLRLPADSTASEIDANIERVLRTVGLADRQATFIRDLSGGQKKRVSIAMELLSSPQALFLDEVTSGLDLGTEQQMMRLFRTLADDGITVVLVTHHLDSLTIADSVAYFARGRLAFYGPPDQLSAHFGISELREIYEAEKETPPEIWEEKFKKSKEYKVLVKLRLAREKALRARQTSRQMQHTRPRGQFLRQWRVLTLRQLSLMRREFHNILLLVGLAPAVAVMLCVVSGSITVVNNPVTLQEYQASGSKQNLLCFGAAIIVLFLSLFGSVREIVKETNIYRHERFINMQIWPYYLSKALPLIGLGFIQVLLVTFTLQIFGGIHAGSVGIQLLLLGLVSVLGTLMGLAISAAAKSSDWAIICMIAVVIPEILFSGALVPARGYSGWISQGVIGVYWALRGLLGELDVHTRAAILGNPPANQVFVSVCILCTHALLMAVAALIFLAAKDEHGVLSRLWSYVQTRIMKRVLPMA